MPDLIDRQAALAFPFANGRYDRENADKHFIRGCESYKEYLESLPVVEERRAGQWIPVSERLPEEEERVILSVRGDVMDGTFEYTISGERLELRSGRAWIVGDWVCHDDVVAWMPLPEPYKESGNG